MVCLVCSDRGLMIHRSKRPLLSDPFLS